jgi:hypothetical protein
VAGHYRRRHSLTVQEVCLQYGVSRQTRKCCSGCCCGGLRGWKLYLRAALAATAAGNLASWLQQTQLAGADNRFDAPLDLEFAEDTPIVPFNSIQGQEKPLANVTIRESLGNKLQHF